MSGYGASSPKRRGGGFIALALAGLLLGAAPARPVVEALDGDTLRLADGAIVRLAAIQAPKAPTSPNAGLEALAARAQAALAALAVGQPVMVDAGGRPPDRYGRTVALVTDGAGRLLQTELLRAGMARVVGGADQRPRLAALYEAEAAARAERRGLWALGLYGVRRADALGGERDGFVIVEGRVRSVEARGRAIAILLDGLTLLVPPAGLRLFRTAGIAPSDLTGQPIRVRGWLIRRDGAASGPTIEIAFPEQIERP